YKNPPGQDVCARQPTSPGLLVSVRGGSVESRRVHLAQEAHTRTRTRSPVTTSHRMNQLHHNHHIMSTYGGTVENSGTNQQ
ncbi:AGAP008975-PA, partial [Anopheles gambiae str. PEST]